MRLTDAQARNLIPEVLEFVKTVYLPELESEPDPASVAEASETDVQTDPQKIEPAP